MIENEKEIIDYLSLPSIPKREWDGKSPFKRGIAITHLLSGYEAYAVASFDTERDTEPRIIKVFTLEPYDDFRIVAVVPEYMDIDGVKSWDLPEASKEAAEKIIEEAEELENKGVVNTEIEAPQTEYCYPEITNDEQAKAFIRAWNASHNISGTSELESHDEITAKLAVMWLEDQKAMKPTTTAAAAQKKGGKGGKGNKKDNKKK